LFEVIFIDTVQQVWL